MQRRRALVVAGTMAATLTMAGTAMAVNLGLLGSTQDQVGRLSPTEVRAAAEERPQRAHRQRPPRVRVIVQDIPVAGGAGGSGGSGGVTESAAAPAAPAATPVASSAPASAPAFTPPATHSGGSSTAGPTDHDDDDDHGDDVEEPEEPDDD